MYAELMNENVRIRAENVMLRKVVFALIAQADKDPFMSIGYFAEHGHASSALAEIRALNGEREQQSVQDVNSHQICETHQPISTPCCQVCLIQDRDRHRDGRLAALERAAKAESDVSALVEVLTELCDEIDKHEIHAAISKTSISWFKRKARKALAAHRKQGGEVCHRG